MPMAVQVKEDNSSTAGARDVLIEVRGLAKTFKIGGLLTPKLVPALREVLGGRAILGSVDDLDGLIAAAESATRPAPPPPAWTWEDAAAATWEVYSEVAES